MLRVAWPLPSRWPLASAALVCDPADRPARGPGASAAFDPAVEQVTEAAGLLMRSRVTLAPPKDREAERIKAQAESARRFGRPEA